MQDEDKLREILYNKLLKIYETEPLTMQSKALYDLIINNAAVNADATICLIGNELGNRGNNDYFTLKLLEKLQHDDSKVQIDILVSNHGVEFLRMREAGYPSDF